MFKLCLLAVTSLALGPQAAKGLAGGHYARSGDAPYHVFLMKGTVYFCSGALISCTHVLSAGTCVILAKALIKEFKVGLTAVVGTNNILKNNDGDAYDIEGQIFFPQYNTRYWNHDIGIFTLKTNVWEKKYVARVEINVQPVVIGSTAVVFAAGPCVFNGPISPYLKKLSVEIIDLNICRDRLPQEKIYDSNICATALQGGGICSRDHGGPLVKDNVLLGVAIEGTVPCGSDKPDIYIDVSQYKGWISQNTK